MNSTKRRLSDEERSEGILLSFLTNLLKANRGNNPRLIDHFFRERLGERKDRRLLNTAVNKMIGQIKKTTPKQRSLARKPTILESVPEPSLFLRDVVVEPSTSSDIMTRTSISLLGKSYKSSYRRPCGERLENNPIFKELVKSYLQTHKDIEEI